MTRHFSRVLVTGGAGFIGSHIVDRLLNEGLKVIVVDNLKTGSLENIANHQHRDEFRFMKGDIRNFNFVKNALKDIDAVFHEAAIVSVDSSVKDPILTNETNLKGTLNLLKASCDLDVKRFVFASSAAVYGNAEQPQKKEDDLLNPTSPYGVSKLAAENYVRVFQTCYGLPAVCLRYFNVYGPRQRVDIHSCYGGVISIFINRILRDLPPIIYGDGNQTRDFVYVEDVVEANMLALKRKDAEGETFNIGSGKSISIDQIAEKLKHIMKKEDLENLYAEPRPGDAKHGFADISKVKKILEYNPRFSIEEGLIKLVDWHTQKRHSS